MYDVIIVGAGPAGVSASLYTIRGNLKTLMIYKEKSSLEKALKVENYYGFKDGIKGEELYKIGIEQAKKLGVEVLEDEVTNIQIDFDNKTQKIFKVETLSNEFKAKTVILATGNKAKSPQIENLKKFEGKGVSYCAICDGFFYRGKNIAVIGNGNYAISEVIHLQNIVKTIKILTNGKQIPEYRAENVDIIDKRIKDIIR